MRIGVFADAHDHLDNVRRAVEVFNRRGCDLVVFAGDFVSPIVLPPLRKLKCKMLACFGDNEGNRVGIHGGFRILGQLAESAFGFRTPDGKRILVTHVAEHARVDLSEFDVVISAHTHKPHAYRDDRQRLHLNPGETSGWTYRQPTVAILETETLAVEVVSLLEQEIAIDTTETTDLYPPGDID
ncbi:MAG: metallophosphoesterase [Planctomycetaceae bacterium]